MKLTLDGIEIHCDPSRIFSAELKVIHIQPSVYDRIKKFPTPVDPLRVVYKGENYDTVNWVMNKLGDAQEFLSTHLLVVWRTRILLDLLETEEGLYYKGVLIGKRIEEGGLRTTSNGDWILILKLSLSNHGRAHYAVCFEGEDFTPTRFSLETIEG